MVVCPHGGERKPGVNTHLHVDPAYIATYLAVVPGGMGWFQPFASYLPTIDVDLGAICELDPPEMPDITFSDLVALIQKDQAALAQSAGFKFAQLVHNIIWYINCQCASGDPTPTGDTIPAAPSEVPTVNPGSPVVYGSATPCLEDNWADGWFNSGSTGLTIGSRNWVGSNVTAIRATFKFTPAGTHAHPNGYVRFHWQTASGGTFLFNTDINFTNNVQQISVLTPPDTAHYVLVEVHPTTGSTDDTYSMHMEYFCNSVPGTVPIANPCCPPDPILASTLLDIQTQLQLLQRQLVPFAYIEGDSHTDLTGTGEFDVQGIIGLKVSASIPAWLGSRAGTPTRFYDSGRVDLGTADGWIHSRYLDTADVIWFPEAAGVMTKVGYTLEPGVTISITPLIREA